jgi:hypothetical protein
MDHFRALVTPDRQGGGDAAATPLLAARSLRRMMRAGKYPHVFAARFDSGPIKIVPDEELQQLAEEAGPTSIAASMLKELKSSRSKDRQYYAFHLDEYFFIGPVPDAETEADLLALADLLAVAP